MAQSFIETLYTYFSSINLWKIPFNNLQAHHTNCLITLWIIRCYHLERSICQQSDPHFNRISARFNLYTERKAIRLGSNALIYWTWWLSQKALSIWTKKLVCFAMDFPMPWEYRCSSFWCLFCISVFKLQSSCFNTER